MLGGLEGIIGLACSALCCLLFVIIVIGLGVVLMRKKGDDQEPSSGADAPSAALSDEGEDPVTDMASSASSPAPAPLPEAEQSAEPPTVKAGPRMAAPPMPPREPVPSSRSVNLDEPQHGGLAAGPSATIIPPDDWIDDNEDDATLLMPKKPPE